MDIMKTAKPIDILLVEDNPGDIRLLQEVFKSFKMYNHMHVVMDGVQAMQFLHKEGEYVDMHMPDLILLDLNLPKMDGREVLTRIKQNKDLKHIPVVVLTTSKAEWDIFKAYDLHANCYITKPVDLDQFINVIKSIENYWFMIVTLPRGVENDQ